MIPTDKLPEHCPEAEWMLIACILEKPEILPNVTREHFYLNECWTIFERALEFATAGKELEISVPMSFARDTALFSALIKAQGDLPSPLNWPYWLDVLDEYRVARQTGKLAAEISLAATNLSPAEGIDLQFYASKLAKLQTPRTKPEDVKFVVDRAMADIEAEYNDPKSVFGLPTGIRSLDRITRGLHPGNMVILAARPGIGKTAFALNIAYEIGINQLVPVTFFSLEMASDKLIRRMIHAESGVQADKIQAQSVSGFDMSQMAATVRKIRKAPLRIYDRFSSIRDICSAIDSDCIEHRPKLVVVDYIQRVSTDKIPGGRQFEVAAISRALKDIAMRHKCTMLALSQISRAVEKDNRQPQLSDLRDSGQIEQDADVVMFLHSTEPRNPELKQAEIRLLIEKNRSGPLGVINLVFRYEATKFFEEAYDYKR